MAPGCTNTVEYEIYGLNMSARFTTDDPNAVRYTQAVGREQAWARLVVGQRTLYPVITGGIFEFGFWIRCSRCSAAFVSGCAACPAVSAASARRGGDDEPPPAHRRAGSL